MAWLIILSNARAAAWVVENATMGFRSPTSLDRVSPGDSFAIYVSRGAHGQPNRDEAQVIATGTIASPVRQEAVVIAGQRYAWTCSLRIDASLPLREGAAFRPLVQKLSFIRVKDAWPAYVRRTIVEIPEKDYSRIASAVARAAARHQRSPAR